MGEHKDWMLRNEWYLDEPDLVADRRRCWRLLDRFNATITIGNDARIGPRTQLLAALHPVEDHERRRAGWERPVPVTIGSNAWLGAGVIVCPGVTIGDDAVVGAGSVVVRDVPDRTFAAGNPVRVIRRL